jgi:RimJ/RimL family protein N-acetyltransferase
MSTFQMVGIRLARPEDAQEILRWRNDADARSMSRNGAVIDEEQHKAWFSGVLKDPRRILLIGINLDKEFGMVRFDRNREKLWETNIVIAPETRGRGLGRLFLDMALRYFFSEHPDASLLAEIKCCNVSSQRLFSSLGFKCAEEDGQLLRFFLSAQEAIGPSEPPSV